MMRKPSAIELLDAWECGLEEPSYERALTLLATAMPETEAAELEQWSIGRRDASLLQLREILFGQQLVCVATCLHCGTALELDFTTTDITAPPAVRDSLTFSLSTANGEYVVALRPINTVDLRAVANQPHGGQLLRRSVVQALRNGEPCSADSLPPELSGEIAWRVETADPQAAVQLDLRCAECGYSWAATFDIASFLWSEVDYWAERTLREVHLLASSYGWSEAEILAMTPRRRQRYLDMVTA